MSSIKDEALNFERGSTKNVADLDLFDVNMELETFNGTKVNKDGEEESFSYKYVTDKNGVRYRVPGVVLGQIKEHLEVNPDLTFFKVNKTGTGLQTQYTAVPIISPNDEVKVTEEVVE